MGTRPRTRPASAISPSPSTTSTRPWRGGIWSPRSRTTRTSTSSATSAAPRGSSWSWRRSSADDDLHGRPAGERLVDDAVALGQLHQGGELLLVEVVLEVEHEPDRAEAHRRLPVHR